MHPDKADRAFLAARAKATPDPKSGEKPSAHLNKRPSQKEINAVHADAQVRYQRLNLITELLKGEGRARYDHFLKNGFPKWRSTGYYYERYRPGLITTLLGLWVFTGGLVHYGVLVLGYRQKRTFMDKYIRQARKQAFGSEAAVAAAIPGLDRLGETVSASSAQASQQTKDEAEDGAPEPRNRKERRMQEKMAASETKKGKTAAASKRPAAQVRIAKAEEEKRASAPPEKKRRVIAPNGKPLLVSKSGDVYLEEVDDDGEVEEHLLDPESLALPGFMDTALVRAPVWAFELVRSKIMGNREKQPEMMPDVMVEEVVGAANGNGSAGGMGGGKRR